MSISHDSVVFAEYYKRAIKKDNSETWTTYGSRGDLSSFSPYYEPETDVANCNDQFALKVAACNYNGCSEYSSPTYFPPLEAVRPREVLAGSSLAVDGYFFRFGTGVYDWVYVGSDLSLVAKLTGMNSKGFLTWDMLHTPKVLLFSTVSLSDQKDALLFGTLIKQSTNEIAVQLSGQTFPINGYFAHYGEDAYDKVYVTGNGKIAAKIFKLDTYGFFNWNILQGGQNQSFESIDFNPDDTSIAFGEELALPSSDGQSSSEAAQNCRDNHVNCPTCGEDETLTYFDDGSAFCKPMHYTPGKILKTGQITSYTLYDDGYYRKGICHGFDYTLSNGYNVMTDNVTKLQWHTYSTDMPWQINNYENAKEYCEMSSVGGYTDWRLPTIDELETLMDYSYYSGCLYGENLGGCGNRWFWTSSRHNGPSPFAVYFPRYDNAGWQILSEKSGTVMDSVIHNCSNHHCSVKCVR